MRRAGGARQLDGRPKSLRRQIRLNQEAGHRRIFGRELARFLEGGDRLVELIQLLVGKAEMRQQHAERRFGSGARRNCGTAGPSTSTTS